LDQDGRGMEENFRMTSKSRFWGLRPWRRHSMILMVFGILFVFFGLNYIYSQSTSVREIALKVLLQIAPVQFWGGIFVAAGLLCILSTRWPPYAETWGYMVLTGLGAGWAATYLMGVLFLGAPAANLSQVLLWSGLSFAWWAISGLPNPEKPER
jgi:hypothetical protein